MSSDENVFDRRCVKLRWNIISFPQTVQTNILVFSVINILPDLFCAGHNQDGIEY